MVISEIQRAIEQEKIARYHFNLFRSILEKTANFLGYENKNKCLKIMENAETTDGLALFKKTLDHYSHDSLWDLAPANVGEQEKIAFEQSFNAFIKNFNWETKNET